MLYTGIGYSLHLQLGKVHTHVFFIQCSFLKTPKLLQHFRLVGYGQFFVSLAYIAAVVFVQPAEDIFYRFVQGHDECLPHLYVKIIFCKQPHLFQPRES